MNTRVSRPPSFAALAAFAHAVLSASTAAQVTTTAVLAPAQAAAGDFSGFSVALQQDRALIGSQSGNGGSGSGSGYACVYERNNGGPWTQVATLTPIGAASGDNFGSATALSGARALIGARYANAPLLDSGAAYVFEDQGAGTWWQTAKLVSTPSQPYDAFGASCAIDGEYAIVGAPSAHVPGSMSSGVGAVFLFELQGGSWVQVASSYGGTPNGQYGASVALQGTTALVGNPGVFFQTGSVDVFERAPTGGWSKTATVLPPTSAQVGTRFGDAVSLDTGRALVGAPLSSEFGTYSGSAYVYKRTPSGSSWSLEQTLLPGPNSAGTQFGSAVTLLGSRAAVAAPDNGSCATCAGRVTVYEPQPSGTWTSVKKLEPTGLSADALFGASLAMHGSRLLTGAPYDDLAGVNSGSGWLFQLAPLQASPATISVSSGGLQQLQIDAGSASAGHAYLVLGTISGTAPGTPLPGGLLLPLNWDSYLEFTLTSPNSIALANSLGVLDAEGEAVATFTLPPASDPSLAGLVAHHAFVELNLAAGLVIEFASNAQSLQLLP